MKKSKTLLLPLLLMTFGLAACGGEMSSSSSEPTSSSSSNEDPGDFVYELNEAGDAYSVSYAGPKNVTSLIMPGTYNGIDVTVIQDGAFADMENLVEIHLPYHLEKVGKDAFRNNYSLIRLFSGSDDLPILKVNDKLYNAKGIEFADGNFNESPFPYLKLDGYSAEGNLNYKANVKGIIDSFSYSIAMNEESPYKAEGSVDLTKADRGIIEVGAHGLYKQSYVELYKGETKLAKIELPELGIYTDNYNLAFLTATYPATIFTLKAPTITDDGRIPTYTMLERYGAFDWDNLQWNIRALPSISKEKATSSKNAEFFGHAHEWMAEYVKDLYTINPHMHATFYVTDLSVDYLYYIFVAQRIPEDQYKVVMLSDGTASAAKLCKTYATFAQGNPSQKHVQMMDSLTKVKNYIYKNGWDYDYISKNLLDFNGGSSLQSPSYFFGNHSYSTLCLFKNSEWWVNRFRGGENLKAIYDLDPDFVSTLLSTKGFVQNIYANSLLAGLSEENVAKFQSIFHFDSEQFDASRQAGKKIMVILGTSWSGESDLYGLVKATMDLYGNAYDYYYKPHPGWPTSTCPQREAVLKRLSDNGYQISEIDGAVAAEIIMFFNKDIYLAGYSSTTYASLDETNEGMGQCDWTANTSEYTDHMYTYLSKLAADASEYATYGLNTAKAYYVVHFNPGKTPYEQHDIGFICEDGTISYFKDGVAVNI